MKTAILLFGFVLFSASHLQAQIEKGRVQIGGNLNVTNENYSQNTGNTNYTDFTIHPSVGRFYATNKLAGLFLSFSYLHSFGEQYDYCGGIYLRQYQPIIKALYVFAEEQGGVNYIRYKNTSSGSSAVNGYAISAGIRPGIAYDLTRRMQLELAYNNLLTATYNYSRNAQIFSLGSNLEGSAFQNLLVGFRFYLK